MQYNLGNLVIYPNEFLKKKVSAIDNISLDEFNYIKDYMFSVMYKNNGCGLAANQIGLDAQIFVLNVSGKRENVHNEKIFINPKIINYSKIKLSEKEGCLSIPKTLIKIQRPKKVLVEYMTFDGLKQKQTFDGRFARIFQHEWDHLQGKLILDYIDMESISNRKKGIKNKPKSELDNMMELSDEVLKELGLWSEFG